MKKIMFNDKYGLTQAVLEDRKTITRRAVPMHDYKYGFQVWYDTKTKQCCVCDGSFIVERSRYSAGEVVAIAQAYKDIYNDAYHIGLYGRTAGWTNKMYVCADDMPHHIKITNIRIERLQDISDDNCLSEGVVKNTIGYYVDGLRCKDWEKESHVEMENGDTLKLFPTPREAFAALINKVSGKGTWESNPYVWVYEFELVD